MIDFQVAFDKLASLETADDLAELFRDHGVKARPADSRSCAITVWLEDQTGLNVATNTSYVRVVTAIGHYEYEDDRDIAPRQLSPAMAEFVRRFDAFMYPDLMKHYNG